MLLGCLLGMSILLVMDTDRADRAKCAKELNSIFESIMHDGHGLCNAERATLFMLDDERDELWSRVATGTDGIITVKSTEGLVGQCVQSGEIVNVLDAYREPNFNKAIDESTGFRTKSVLVVPVKDVDGEKIIGAIQMINKDTESSEQKHFDSNDEKICAMLASHVAAFIRVVDGR